MKKKDKDLFFFDDLKIFGVNNVLFKQEHIHRITPSDPEVQSIELISEGEVLLKTDGCAKHLKAPILFWIGSRVRDFKFEHISGSRPYRHLWVDFTGERGKKIYSTLLRAFPAGYLTVPREDLPEIITIFYDLYGMYHNISGYDAGMAVLSVEKLLYLMLKIKNKIRTISGDPYNLSAIYEECRHKPFQNFNLREQAFSRGISPVYLRLLFKLRFGVSIQQFVRMIRIQSAADMLHSRKYRISELSDMCGYTNLPAFSYAFRKMYGVSPKEYSENIKPQKHRSP